MRKSNFFWALLGLIPLFLFNNCDSLVRFSSNRLPFETQLSSGNGTGYEGKPSGNFYHFLPDFQCEQNESAKGVIQINIEGITYKESGELQCDSTPQNLKSADIEASPFHTRLVGYQDMIFEKKEGQITEIPERLVEAWCFNASGPKTFEMIIQYERALGAATAAVHYKKSSAQETNYIPEQALSRLVTKDSVSYQTLNSSFFINKASPAADEGKFNGEFKGEILGEHVEISLVCRLGADLDARLWPAKVLSTNVIKSYDFFRVPDQIYAISEMASKKRYLSRFDLSNQLEAALTSVSHFGTGVNEMKVNRDRGLLVYTFDDQIPFAFRLFAMDLNIKDSWPLSAPLIHSDQRVFNFYVDRDWSNVYYTDGVQETTPGDVEQWLRASAIDGSVSPIQLSQNMPLGEDFSVYWFEVSEAHKRAIYQVTSQTQIGAFEIWSAAFDGSDAKKISPNFDLRNVQILFDRLLGLAGPLKEFVYFAGIDSSRRGLTIFTTWVMNIDGSNLKTFSGYLPYAQKELANETSNKIDLSHLLILNQVETQEQLIYNLESKQTLTLERFGMTLFLDRDQLLGTRDDQVFMFNLTNQKTQEICRLKGRLQSLKLLDVGLAFAASTNDSQSFLYLIQSGQCLEFNHFPLTKNHNPIPNSINHAALAPDNKSLLYILKNNLFWIPLNGCAPVKVNVPVANNQTLHSAHFTSDSKAIVYQGDQIRSNAPMLFYWKPPNTCL